MAIELVVGLGNPGPEYASTRHNIGYRVVDEVVGRHGGGRAWLTRPSCELAVVSLGRMVVAARPLTFMNRSGRAARELLDGLELEPGQMLVVVDDVDLPLAALRLRRSGGPGTHNGLRDLCAEVGQGFPRLRVGVRGDTMDGGDLADYVLSPFAKAEAAAAEAAVARATDAVESALRDGFEVAMNIYNHPPNKDEF